MPLDRDALRQRLLASFRAEAAERLAILADALANWREGGASQDDVESLFREVHSIKGASRAAGVSQIEQLCHAWESLLSGVRHGDLELSRERVELCRLTLKVVQRLHAEQPVEEHELAQLIDSLNDSAMGQEVALPAVEVGTAEVSPQDPATVRVSTQRLDALLFHSEVLLQHKLEAQAHFRALQEHAAAFEPQRSKRMFGSGALRQLRESLNEMPEGARDGLRSVLDYLDWSLSQFDRLHFGASRLAKAGGLLAQGLTQLSESLTAEMQDALLLSGSSLFEGVPAMVQDLASQAGKRAELEVRGASLQIDKRILDELRVVLTHLLRNAIDHGLETPEQRALQGKSAAGKLLVELVQESADRFELRVGDDGQGIDVRRLKAKAVSAGRLSPEQAENLGEREALALIFVSGLSTSPMLTDISGRGLGMAIIQDTVERIGGRIETETQPGAGTCFHLHLPLSLSTFRAVIVRNAERVFAVPALAVERCLRVSPSAIRTLENRPTLAFEGQVLPLWPLGDVLGLAQPALGSGDLTLLLLRVRGERFVLLVEELLGDQEIIVKSLGKQLLRVRNLMGATLLGDGQLVPILHPADLYRSALASEASSLSQKPREQRGETLKRLLIAEDSFTSRGLLKAILEAAGYRVTTANDGLEAWNALKQGQFDLLVSDVEMPRLDGFTLTCRIRADRELAELPVVLVTALHSAEDRARGLESGANAYLAKSGFEQDSLLEAIRRLL
ncbi:response regulator [Pseudomonas sp. ML96]|uniref:hybrid sensor histidine kinase/response regulator n=1 Tax=Pseudomonas sp. ML96 TaxID=1523503 RepID=UPI0005B97279|nr:response regulator [Pseudomonas sp. ML96]